MIVNARKALDPDAPLIRDDKPGKTDNLATPTWEAGDEEATERVFAEADMVVERDIMYPRCHPAPMETCGMIADFNPETGQLDIYNGNQAPHVHRTVYAHVAGLAEHMIRIMCNDIGGGFGNKVPVYPGYVCAIAGSIVAGKPVKWIEDRSENLMSTGFARDYIMHSSICAKDGKITGLKVDVIADHGAFDSTAQPTKFPAGFFHICCGPTTSRRPTSRSRRSTRTRRRVVSRTVAPSGSRRPCTSSSVWSSARNRDGRGPDRAADAQLHPAGAVPVRDDHGLDLRLRQLRGDDARGDGYRRVRGTAPRTGGEARPRRAHGDRRVVLHGGSRRRAAQAHGHSRHVDERWADLRVHPSGKAVVSISCQTQGQGHETTFAQIVSEELGIPPEDVTVRHGDTDKSPYGLGTYGSRSTPVSGGAVAIVSRKVRDRARLIAATMLETRPEDLAWEKGRWYVKGDPEQGAMIEDIAKRAYSGEPLPEGYEGGLDAQVIYDQQYDE